MSKKLNDILPEEDSFKVKTFSISPSEFEFTKDLDNLRRAADYHYNRLIQNYLRMVAFRLGYRNDKQVEFSIDLSSDKRELTISEVLDK